MYLDILIIVILILIIWKYSNNNENMTDIKSPMVMNGVHTQQYHPKEKCDYSGMESEDYLKCKVHNAFDRFTVSDRCGRYKGCILYDSVYKPCSRGYQRIYKDSELLCVRDPNQEEEINSQNIQDYCRSTEYHQYTDEEGES